MNNSQIAEVFENIAGLLEMKGEPGYTVRAYQRAARTIERLPEDVGDMLRQQKDLRELTGIGKAIADKTRELVDAGKLGYYERLKSEFPAGILEMMHVPGGSCAVRRWTSAPRETWTTAPYTLRWARPRSR